MVHQSKPYQNHIGLKSEFYIQILNANPEFLMSELLFSSKQKAERLLFFSRNSHTQPSGLVFPSFYLRRSIGGNLVAVGSTKENGEPALSRLASFRWVFEWGSKGKSSSKRKSL